LLITLDLANIEFMIDTTRIKSEFDIELQIGNGWFFTAIKTLNDFGLLLPDGPPSPFDPTADVVIVDVFLFQDPIYDLQIELTIGIIPITILATIVLNDGQLDINTNFTDVFFSIPFGVLEGLAGSPVLLHLEADVDNAECMALLANMDIQAGPQADGPLPDGEMFERGKEENAISFLPNGKDIALGLASATFQRFANNIWHTDLRIADGTHPLPDEPNKVGEWDKITVKLNGYEIKFILEGDIPVDSPWIDLVPDPHVSISIILKPTIDSEGNIKFDLTTETDIDTGILGDIFAFFAGGIIGFVVGLFTGNPLGGAIAGAITGVVVLEIAEVVVEGVVQKEIAAKINGEKVASVLCAKDGIAQFASKNPDGDSIDLSVLQSFPSSIPIYTDNPDILHSRTILVTAKYNELQLDGNGLAVAGMAESLEKFQSKLCDLQNCVYENGILTQLKYTAGGESINIARENVSLRMGFSELKAPFKVLPEQADSSFRIPEGKLATMALIPDAIRRENSVVTEIPFTNGLDLTVADSISLQDDGALYVMGLQLIHPVNAHPYYRAKADGETENNFENLPEF